MIFAIKRHLIKKPTKQTKNHTHLSLHPFGKDFVVHRNHLAKSNWMHNPFHLHPCPSSTISLKMKVWGSGCRPSQKGKSKWIELTTTQPKPEAVLTTLYCLLYFLEEQWQQLMRTSKPQLQRHWRRTVRTQAWNTHPWPSTDPQGLEDLGRNQTCSLKGFVLLHSLVSVGRDYLHEEHPKY